jgi:MFS family permease
MLTLLRSNPPFRRLFVAHAASRAGDAFNTVALVVLVFDLTGSGLGVAATVVFEVLPIVALGPVAGLLADRLPRRSVMIGADLFRAGLVSLLAVAHGTTAAAFAVAFGMSVGTVLFNPAASSVVPDLVGDEHVVDANAVLWTVAVAAQVVLASLAGGLIAWAGVGVAFGINAASYVVSAAVLRRIPAVDHPAPSRTSGWRQLTAGVVAVRRSPLLARLAVVQVLASLAAGASGGLLIVLATERLGVGSAGFGVLLSCIGIGAALGPMVLRRHVVPGNGRWLFGPFALRGGVDLTLAATTSPVVAGGALALYGIGTSTGAISFQSTLQVVLPPSLRGRVFALYDVVWNVARLVSLGAGGVLADAVSISAVYVVSGLLLLLAAAVGLFGGRVQEGSS